MPLVPYRRKGATEPLKVPSRYSYENMMKQHQLKHASIDFRNNLLKSRANAAYKNEYDRVHSMLQHHILHNSSPYHELLKDRKEHLKKLVSDRLYPQHELFKKEEN